MPRCSICDYSNETPSIYYESSEIRKPNPRTFSKDPKTNDTLCSTCEETVNEAKTGGFIPAESGEIIETTFDED